MNGFIEQWGRSSKNGNVTITFPVQYMNPPSVYAFYESGSADYVYQNQKAYNVSINGFNIYVNNAYMDWSAKGY